MILIMLSLSAIQTSLASFMYISIMSTSRSLWEWSPKWTIVWQNLPTALFRLTIMDGQNGYHKYLMLALTDHKNIADCIS
jgi:hypothetical protein